MLDLNETFFTSIGCMDGRAQKPVTGYGKKRYGVLYADTITEAGLVGLLANNPPSEIVESLKKKVLISVEKHHSKGIVVHGHQECAGNPVGDNQHREETKKTAETIRGFVSGVEVKPVFVIKENGNWIVEEI